MSEKIYKFTAEEHEFLLRVCKKAKRLAEINIAPTYVTNNDLPFIESLIEKLENSHV